MDYNKFIDVLKKEIIPALGCTEPTAVAYASAKAVKTLGKKPEKLQLFLSGNIIKNGMGVGIPGTGMKGLFIAAALGAIGGNSDKVLEVLQDASSEEVETAKKFAASDAVKIDLAEVPNKLYIEVNAYSGSDSSKVVIKDFHTAITLIEKNGEKIFEANCDDGSPISTVKEDRSFLTVDSIYDFIVNVPLEKISFMEEAIKLNEAIAEEGLKNDYGLKVGKTRLKNVSEGILNDNVETYAIALTAAASDARMAGSTFPVMSNSGSGNQGITATVPVIAAARKMNASFEQLIKAVTLSNLIAIHMKDYLGRLSALCGCVIASAGSSCGISYLMGGGIEEIKATIKNMLGNISGMICDGAKPGCSVKIATGVSAGIQSALLAKDGIVIGSDEGIIDENVEKTIVNVCDIGKDGMRETDRMILNIMVSK